MTARDQMLNDVAARLSKLVNENTVRVGIGGIDAAGKTTLADELAERLRRLGRPVIRSGIDHFHNPREIRYAKGPDSPDGYYEDSFNLDDLIEKLLCPLGPGGTGRYRTAQFDHRRNSPVDSPEVTAPPATILLFDGIFLQQPRLRPYWDCRIFVKVGFDVALARSLRRDLPSGGDAARLAHRHRCRYQPGQQRYLAECKPEAYADLIIENDDPANPSLRDRLGPR